jgi:peptide/nickel transport system substrate-binding protein
MRRQPSLLAIFLITAILLSACGGGLRGAPYVQVGWNGDPDTLNPGMATLDESFSIFNLIYDGLYEFNLDGSYRLSLAESVNVSEDGKVWTFNIRDGVRFSDGQPLTAEDVAYSFNLYSKYSEEFIFMPGYTTYFQSVIAPSKDQVVITLKEAIPNMESQLYALYVLPKHIWEKVKDPTDPKIPLGQTVGSGPFKLVEYVPGQYIRLESRTDHFLYSPKVAGVEFRIYADMASMIEALSNQDIDLIVELPVDAVSALKGMKGVEVVAGPAITPSVADIIMNQVNPAQCPVNAGGLCTGHPALGDRNVRLAMAHAIDKHRMIDETMLGLADPGLTLIPKGLGSFYNSSIHDYEYDAKKANQILDGGGYLDINDDGVREMPDGNRDLTFRLEWPSDMLYARREADLLKLMWAQIGIDVIMQPVDPAELTRRCCPSYDYDILLWNWSSDPDPNFLLSVMLTDEIPSGYNETGYSNPEYDRLYGLQATELNDEERRSIIWQMQNLVHRDVVYIIPFYRKSVQAYRSNTFRGWLTDKARLDLDDRTSLGIIEPLTQ